MRRLGTLLLSTVLLAGPFLGSATYAGSATAAGAGHHKTKGFDRGGALSWTETVIDADQSFRGLDAVDRRTAWVTGGSATEGGPGRVFRTTEAGPGRTSAHLARKACCSVMSRHAVRTGP
jgi:hypothetical protein